MEQSKIIDTLETYHAPIPPGTANSGYAKEKTES